MIQRVEFPNYSRVLARDRRYQSETRRPRFVDNLADLRSFAAGIAAVAAEFVETVEAAFVVAAVDIVAVEPAAREFG